MFLGLKQNNGTINKIGKTPGNKYKVANGTNPKVPRLLKAIKTLSTKLNQIETFIV